MKHNFFKEHVEPNLYLLSMTACLAAACGIFLNDLFRGTAVASAITLYYLINGFFRQQRYMEQEELLRKNLIEDDKSQ